MLAFLRSSHLHGAALNSALRTCRQIVLPVAMTCLVCPAFRVMDTSGSQGGDTGDVDLLDYHSAKVQPGAGSVSCTVITIKLEGAFSRNLVPGDVSVH